MNKYIQRIEKMVDEKLAEAIKPKGKGLLAPKKNKIKDVQSQDDVFNLIANFVADIRMKRMEYKQDKGTYNE
jgi:hypothetical protein